MKTHPASTVSLADVKQLTYFRIYKTHPGEQHGTIALFSNGNQQCPIKVGLVAADAVGNPIDLTQEHVKTALELIHYDSGDVLGSVGDGYTASFTKNTFTWMESVIPVSGRLERKGERNGMTESSPALADPTPDIQTFTLYVSASTISSGRTLAARFNVGKDLIFTTNSAVDDSDGQGQDGQFNSSVEVLLAPPPQLSASDFGAASNGVITGRKVGDSTTHFYWATEYYLDPKLNGRALPLLSVGASASSTDAFGFYTHGDYFDRVKWGISYYGQPGSPKADVQGLPKPPLSYVDVTSAGKYGPLAMYTDCVGKIVGANPHRVVIGILKGNLGGQFKDASDAPVADAGETTMHILDAYGNDHSLVLSYDSTADAFSIG